MLDWAWNRVVALKTSIDNTCKSNIYPLQLQWNLSNTTHQGTREICQIVLILRFYLTLCTFSFEINESRLSDTKCLIQDVVSPHCGDKRMARRCTRHSLPNYLVMTSYHWNVERKHSNVASLNERQNNVTSCTKCSLPQNIV